MGFTLQLAQDLIEVEAGGNAPVTIVVSNRGETSDRFEVEIEGLDVDWKAIPVPVFSAEPGETRSERAFFKPPRASESGAGNYPFVVSVRSLESGDQKTVQGVLRLKPFHYLTLEINPKRGVHSWSTHRNKFEISLTNLGNTEHTLQLVGSDPEDSCTYEFEQERITIAPGQQKEVGVEVRPVSSPVFSGSKLIGFSIHARSVDVPSVVVSGQAQLERRSLISPANLTVLVFLVLLCTAWYLMKPKPPGVEVTLEKREGMPGDKVLISWVAHDADHVKITASNESAPIYDGTELVSSVELTLGKTPGQESILAEVSKGNGPWKSVTKTITVDTPEPVIVPKIISFSTTPAMNAEKTVYIKVPGEVIFNFQVQGALGMALQPDYPNLEPGIQSQSVQFTSPADKTYQLVAWSKDKQTTYGVKVRVVAQAVSDANIISFTSDQVSVPYGGQVSLTWNVVNSTQISLKHNGIVDSSLAPADTKSYAITRDTTFVLVALDSKNVAATRKVSVKLQPPSAPPSPTTAGPSDGTGQTGGTTGVSPSPASTTAGQTGGNESGPTTTTGR